MKKTITLPDGTVEVLEGTPEEIAAHEKLIRERTEKQKRDPKVIKGKSLEEMIQELMKKIDEKRPDFLPWWPTERPIWIASCSQCHCHPCQCLPYELYPKIYCGTYTVTGNKVELFETGQRRPALTCSYDPNAKGWDTGMMTAIGVSSEH